jgi:hypothetical protein
MHVKTTECVMALPELWKTNQCEFSSKTVQQVVGFAGKLKDGGTGSKEFREFLSLVPSAYLARYAGDCLNEKFEGSGFALQDVLNEVGIRLGFRVEQGKYRGIQGGIGFDGLWHAPDGNCIVIEVKTTDAYRIDLNTIATYRRKLIAEGRLCESQSSILIVVGRDDTGDLEAQIRGSRHAWDIRMISIDFLLRLMRLKEELEDPKIIEKIRRVLWPQEFTKVDGIIDLVFSAAAEVKQDEQPADEEDEIDDADQKQPKFVPSNFRDACAERVQTFFKTTLIKRSSAVFSTPDEKLVIICLNSREYLNGNRSGFWFAFHPHQQELLEKAPRGYLALGCGSKDSLLLIPSASFSPWLPMCNQTVLEDRLYWHIKVKKQGSGYLLNTKKGTKPVDLTKFLLNI